MRSNPHILWVQSVYFNIFHHFDPVLTGLALKSWRTNAETLRAVTFAAAQGADFLMATPQFDAENAGWTCGKCLELWMKFGLRN